MIDEVVVLSDTNRILSVVVDSLAALLQHKGIKDGETVGVFMSNTPEIMFTQLALSRIGAIPALINTALRSI